MDKVFEFRYNSNTFESAAATVSIHRTREGAENAMALHKDATRKEWDKDHSDETVFDAEYKRLYPFGWNSDWFIIETEIKE